MRMPPLNALRAFEAAARLSSFSKAGDELSVTHAAVSHQIRQLEEWFGRPLFKRQGRGIVLTNAGRQLSGVATEAFAAISEKATRLQRTNASESIVVGCVGSVASRWLVPALPEFSRKEPNHYVELFYVQEPEYLRDEGYDVLISFAPDPSADVCCTKLFSRRSCPVASPEYIKRHGPLDTPQLIAKAAMLHDATRDDWTRWLERAQVQSHRAAKGPVFVDFNMLATAVIAGQGVALCPVEVFRNEIDKGELVVLSDLAIRDDENYYIITSSVPTRAVKRFSDWFVDVCVSGRSVPAQASSRARL